jgi:hypothetical protein
LQAAASYRCEELRQSPSLKEAEAVLSFTTAEKTFASQVTVFTELAESMLETLEGNLHAFDRHRKFIHSRLAAPTRRSA